MKYPFFTIIIATHMRAKLLERAINSVLNQTYTDNNFIIVSDIIDEPTYSLVSKSLRPNDLFIQRNGISGPAESRNIALQYSSGTHVVFLDDDDAFRTHFLKDLAGEISINNNNEDILYTNAEVIDLSKNNDPQILDYSNNINEDLFVKNYLPNNCIAYPIKIAKQNKYDSSLAYEDWDYLLSAMALAKIKHLKIDGPIIFKNSDGNEKSRGEKNNNDLLECYLKIYTKHSNVNKEVLKKRIALFKSIDLDLEILLKTQRQ